MKMKVFFLFLFVVAISSLSSFAAGPVECVSLPDFRYDAGALTTYALVKEGCTLRAITSGGKSEKWEVPLCQKDTQIRQFLKVDDTDPKILKPHTKDCPRPLALGDQNSPEDFAKGRKRIMEIFAQVEETYGLIKQEQLQKMVDVSKANSEVKMACLKALLDQYLEKCMAIPEQKKEVMKSVVPPIDPKNIPPGIHPESIEVEKSEF